LSSKQNFKHDLNQQEYLKNIYMFREPVTEKQKYNFFNSFFNVSYGLQLHRYLIRLTSFT